MTDNDAEFLKRLLVTFTAEADEHLKGMNSALLLLENDEDTGADRAKLVETIFREAHSLKGAARSVNLREIESLCQALEGVFAALKKEEIPTSAALFDLLQEALDLLGLVLATAGAERTHEEQAGQRRLITRLEGAARRETTAAATVQGKNEKKASKEDVLPTSSPSEATLQDAPSLPSFSVAPIETDAPVAAAFEATGPKKTLLSPPPDGPRQKVVSPPVMPETVRVSTTRLTSVLLQAEEMLSAKLASSQRALDMRRANTAFGVWKKEWDRIRPLVQTLKGAGSRDETGGQGPGGEERQRSLARVLDFMEWNSDFLKALEARFRAEAKSAERDSRALGGMVNTLLDDMKKVLMFPFSSLLEILPKTVRDLSRDKGKKIELSINGEEIEIDRRILEEMKDPLMHLMRNCIDHGIESPAERTAKGKSERGAIRVAVAPRDDKVELIVADDGGGIPLAAVRSALLKFGTLSKEKLGELDDQEMVPYIFQSGITTSSIITEISGRGLGLAIVREKVEKLGGTIWVETAPESGTTFRILLPLTVATFRGLLVRLGESLFVLPAMHVERVVRLQREVIKTVENRETITLEGKPVSLARLADVLRLTPAQAAANNASDFLPMVVLAAANTRIAFLVDDILGEQEVLLKGLGRQLSRIRNVAGATVLGNGRVAPILNVTDLLKSAAKLSPSATGYSDATDSRVRTIRRPVVMVAEDSITTRTLLKNILETAGYEVVTAVDGSDALTKLKGGTFDIVVSDVDMPRLNGFELTSKIRNDKNMADLPVVLVTALASREDQEQGIDAGANAYIVKSNFDQGNLLEVIERLL